ncbi:MAG TPA: ABC transporter ATP-binding protein [Ktedonobacteraceae bacterium]|nr:ABC transporter ATP-binding protein [Ktedonobacteraceae bacterium]
MQSQSPIIEMAGLTKQFGRHRAVDNLNLTVHSGSVFGFLGPNGAGKTTTIRMLLGLIRPTQGGGRILGHDIERERAAILPHVGAIVEAPAFYPILSGRDNLHVFARTAGNEDARTIAAVLEQVGLSSRARDKVKTYSLGMKQRLAIAAALLNNPQIIFLDEPTNGLDPAGTVEMRELIGQLGASGHTIFLSSHLLHEVEQVCNEVAIINHGKLAAQGRVAELLKRDASLLIEAEPLATLQDVAARLGVTPQVMGPRTVTVALAPDKAPVLMKALVHADAEVYQVTAQRTSLEHLFLELTDDAHNNHTMHTPAGQQIMQAAAFAERK